MKLKANEIAFLAVCVICAVIGIGLSVYHRTSGDAQLDITTADSSGTAYPVDVLNNATLEDFMAVSGIGGVKAGDIVAFRDAIGGFKRVEQLMDIRGISDATYEKIIEHFYIAPQEPEESPATTHPVATDAPVLTSQTETGKGSAETSPPATASAEKSDDPKAESPEEKTIRSVNINSAGADEIADALLIDYELAEKIAALREEIQYFSSVTELYLVDGMDGDTYRRIKEYIVIGD